MLTKPSRSARSPLPDILEVRDIIRGWIQSCRSSEQLRNLQHVVQDMVVDRYASAGESLLVVVHVSAYLHSLIRVKLNLVGQPALV